jgi:hypothetical protein
MLRKAGSSESARKIGNFIRFLNTFALDKVLQINPLALSSNRFRICLLISSAFFSPSSGLGQVFSYSLLYYNLYFFPLHFPLPPEIHVSFTMPYSTNTVAYLGPRSPIVTPKKSLPSFGRLTRFHLL